MWHEFIKFANSGLVGTAAHYIVLWVLVDLFYFNPVISSAMGAFVGAGVNYIINYHWTFNSKLPHSHTLPRFMAIATFSLALNTWIMVLLISNSDLHYIFAQVVTTATCLTVNYLASRFWAFKRNLQ